MEDKMSTRKLTVGGWCAVAAVVGALITPAPVRAEDDGRALTAAYNASGQQLFKLFLAAAPSSNIVFSPYSIGTAMAMALSGARGENAAEMTKVLAHTLAREQIDAANAEALAILNGYAQSADGKSAAILRIANALMLTRKDAPITEAYQAVLHNKFGAEVFRGADLAQVNDWVKQKTEGKIESILDQLDPNSIAVLLDAIYFKAPWQTTFDASATRDQTFHLVSGEVEVPTMHLHSDFAVATREGYKAIRMPYANGHLAMIVALPDEGAGATELAARLGGDEMDQLLLALHARVHTVDLALPRFKANFKASLVESFQQLGMHMAFDDHAADFSGMSDKPPSELPLAIDQIMHRAVIEVAEEGTEAAAATSVVVGVRSARPPEIEKFQVDRPFLFYLVDDGTGAILFEGRIVDPRAAG
jgi:serpin B